MKVECKLCDFSFDLEEEMEQIREGMSNNPEMRSFLRDMVAVSDKYVDAEELMSEVREGLPGEMLRKIMISHLEEEHSELWQNFLESNFEILR